MAKKTTEKRQGNIDNSKKDNGKIDTRYYQSTSMGTKKRDDTTPL